MGPSFSMHSGQWSSHGSILSLSKICFCNADQLQDRFPGGVSSEFGQGPLLSPGP